MKSKLFASLVFAGITAVPVYAQNTLEEVVVTAQRREQNLQEVPVSVTAFTGATIEQANIRGMADYLAFTPNVAFTEGTSVGARGVGVGIRGVSNTVTDESTFVNSVGVYLNGFSVSSSPTGIINPQLQDMERLEVLRGPQGTYFGRNSVGGALNLQTARPTDELGGKVIIGGESFEDAGEQFNVTGILNMPISENLAARVVINYEDSSGMVENVNPGGNDSDHEYFTGRVSLAWTPTDTTSVDLLMIYDKSEQGTDENVPSGVWDIDTIDTFGLGCDGTAATCGVGVTSGLTAPVDANVLNGSPIGFYPNNRNQTSRDQDERNDSETVLAVLNISHDLNDDVVLKSITGIIGSTYDRRFDNDLLGGGAATFDAALLALVPPPFLVGPGAIMLGDPVGDAIFRDNHAAGTSWSTELRAEITKDAYDLALGFIYSDDRISRGGLGVTTAGQSIVVPGAGFVFPNLPAGIALGSSDQTFEAEGIAAFADLTWHATEKLDLTFGFRYSDDEITNTRENPVTGRPGGSATESFSDFSPRFVVRYQVNDDLGVYATASKGYKAGGTSLNNGPGPVRAFLANPYEEETLWNYEIGIKSEWMDNRVRLNAAAFYIDWTDLQLESFRFLTPGDLTSNAEFTINVDEAEAMGFEVELVAAVTERFTLSAAMGYLDTEITCACLATIKAGFVVNLDGQELPRSPELTGTIIGEYRMPFASGEAWIRGEFIYRDEQTTDIEGVTWEQTAGQVTPSGAGFVANNGGFPYVAPSYEVVNLRAGYEHNESWAVSFFIQNLFDEEYYTGTGEDFGLSGFRLRPHPRIFGGNVSYSFGGI